MPEVAADGGSDSCFRPLAVVGILAAVDVDGKVRRLIRIKGMASIATPVYCDKRLESAFREGAGLMFIFLFQLEYLIGVS